MILLVIGESRSSAHGRDVAMDSSTTLRNTEYKKNAVFCQKKTLQIDEHTTALRCVPIRFESMRLVHIFYLSVRAFICKKKKKNWRHTGRRQSLGMINEKL